jgi:hypothetical protein
MRPEVLGDDSAGSSVAFTFGDLREKDLELGGRGKSEGSASAFSSSSFVNAAKLSRSFFPRPAIEITALDAQPVTLILLLGFGLSVRTSAVMILSKRFWEVRDAERDRDFGLFSASDLRRDGVRVTVSSSESSDDRGALE